MKDREQFYSGECLVVSDLRIKLVTLDLVAAIAVA